MNIREFSGNYSIMRVDPWKVYDPSNIEQGNQIAQCVLNFINDPLTLRGTKSQSTFENALPKINEYTVLSGIVALQGKTVEKTLKKRKTNTMPQTYLLTLTTGLKVLPAEKIHTQSRGRLLHDMHAEILSIRLFNLILLEDIKRINDCSDNDRCGKILRQNRNGLFQLRDSTIKLAMFVTEAPCGDASLENISSRSSSNVDWKDEKCGLEPIRGRSFFNRKGLVRTKPGRRDSQKSLSKSCSDKLCMKQFTSLLNSTTFSFIDPAYRYQFYLEYIVIPEESISPVDVQRCFSDRLNLDKSETNIQDYFHAFKILPTELPDFPYQFKLNNSLNACATSLVYSPVYPNMLEVINKGVLNGRSSKKHINKEASSQLCREALFERVAELNSNCFENIKTYSNFKGSIKELRKIKEGAKKIFKNWGESTIDDFTIRGES